MSIDRFLFKEQLITLECFMEYTNEMVSRYRKYFERWDEVAAVRSKTNNYRLTNDQLNVDLKNKKWFLPSVLPILNHPLLKNINQDEEQYLLGYFLLQFLEYGTLMEHEFVNTILAELALREWNIPLPDCMRVDAFKIYTDEGYHALFNLEATQQIRQYIGLSTSDAWPLKNSRLSQVRKLVPQHSSQKNLLIRFGIVAISETVANKQLAENMQGIVIDSIYNIFLDHAEDEKKHCMYFSVLWDVVWNYLSLDEKKYLGINLPKILKAFVGINTVAFHEALAKIGIERESAEIIINESYPASCMAQRALSVASVSFRIFERLGMFDIPEIKNAFIEEGLLQVIQ